MTKGDEIRILLSVVNSEEIIIFSQIISSQSSYDSDSHISNYESNNGYTKRNYIDDVKI